MSLHILFIAVEFGPQPERGSYRLDPYLAWNLVDQVSRTHSVSVLTHSRNHEAVLNGLSAGELPRVSIHFVEPPAWAQRLHPFQKTGREVFAAWEKRAVRRAASLHAQRAFDVAHHLTPCFSGLCPQVASDLSLPAIWGPIYRQDFAPAPGIRRRRDSNGGRVSIGRAWGKVQAAAAHRRRNRSLDQSRALLVGDPSVLSDFPMDVRTKIRFFAGGGISSRWVRTLKSLSEIKGRFNLLAAGDFLHPEGYRLLLRAFQIFLKDNQGAKLTILGRGCSDTALLRLKDDLNISPSQVQCRAWIALPELVDQMRQSDVFVFPDFDASTAPLCVFALAQGLPVLVFEGGGAEPFIQSEWGHVIGWQNPGQVLADLVSGFRWLDSGFVMRRKMGKAAIRMVRKNLEWKAQAEALESIYAEIFLQDENIRVKSSGERRIFY